MMLHTTGTLLDAPLAPKIKVKDDNEVEVEIADGVKVRVVQSTIAQVTSKTEPANS